MESVEQVIKIVRRIPVNTIEASLGNPRGTVEKDASFERLVSSIDRVGILVPLVVRELAKPKGTVKYELVDGERRFLAARELELDKVPAHILQTDVSRRELRKLMFHLHMTREQWEPLAQCKVLAEMYDRLDEGVDFDEKNEWVKRITKDTGMSTLTARDRIHVLAWPKALKTKIQLFDAEEPTRDIYSYVLAIEVSVVVPSLTAFPAFYNHGKRPEKTANIVRRALLDKTIHGIETGMIRSREQIRDVNPLFGAELPSDKKRVALCIFENLVHKEDYFYDDAKAEIEIRIPEVLREKPPKVQKVIASVRSLAQTLDGYEADYIRASTRPERRRQVTDQLIDAVAALISAAERLRKRL
jgi:ParB/RepB/Spo0J family partition protein